MFILRNMVGFDPYQYVFGFLLLQLHLKRDFHNIGLFPSGGGSKRLIFME
jgi:hypothetical protein